MKECCMLRRYWLRRMYCCKKFNIYIEIYTYNIGTLLFLRLAAGAVCWFYEFFANTAVSLFLRCMYLLFYILEKTFSVHMFPTFFGQFVKVFKWILLILIIQIINPLGDKRLECNSCNLKICVGSRTL